MRTIIILGFALVGGGCELDEVHHETLHAHEAAEHHEHGHGHAEHRYVSPEAAARVQLLESEVSGREMEAIGVVDAHEQPGHHEQALQELREAAAAIGAEAVVGVEFHHGEEHGEVSHLSGMAVRFRHLRRDQPYDVVGNLDVEMEMDDQERALAELRRQSRDYHADLIIDIHYEHGEGNGNKIHVRGKAIRYRSGGESGAAP